MVPIYNRIGKNKHRRRGDNYETKSKDYDFGTGAIAADGGNFIRSNQATGHTEDGRRGLYRIAFDGIIGTKCIGT